MFLRLCKEVGTSLVYGCGSQQMRIVSSLLKGYAAHSAQMLCCTVLLWKVCALPQAEWKLNDENTEEWHGINIITDARHGWRKNAKDTCVVTIGEKSSMVLLHTHVTKADDHVTQRHELLGTKQVYARVLRVCGHPCCCSLPWPQHGSKQICKRQGKGIHHQSEWLLAWGESSEEKCRRNFSGTKV